MIRIAIEVSNGKLVTRHTWLIARVISFFLFKICIYYIGTVDRMVGVGAERVTNTNNMFLFAKWFIT